jgi:hypothetical protein
MEPLFRALERQRYRMLQRCQRMQLASGRTVHSRLLPSAKVATNAMSAFFLSNWVNLVTVLGVIVTIVGFIVTIQTLIRTKKAAMAAREAAEATKMQLSRVDTMSDFSSAIEIMDEIKRLHRARAWDLVPDRYSILRRLLTSIQALNPDLSKEQKTLLAGAAAQFRTMEHQVEQARARNQLTELNLARFNRIVTAQLDELDKVMLSIKQAGI